MGCIEMPRDVLENEITDEINRNMGCIEICPVESKITLAGTINRNMGCIEIRLEKSNNL